MFFIMLSKNLNSKISNSKILYFKFSQSNFSYLKYLLFILFSISFVSCSKPPRKTGFEFQREVWDETEIDTNQKTIYLTGTKRVDSVDANKVIFDLYRMETFNYPDTIRMYARVYDSLGNFVTNMGDPYRLDPNTKYFNRIREKLGVIYKPRIVDITDFKVREYGALDSIPYSIVLNIDYSGSMDNVKEVMIEGTNQFIDKKFPYDKMSVITFNNQLDVKVPMLSKADEIKSLFNAKKYNNMGMFSAMYDAVYASMDQFKYTDTNTPRVLVVFSDGDDNYSQHNASQIIERAKKEKINIFAVAFGYSIDDQMKLMTKHTGGKFYKARSKEEMLMIFQDIMLSLRYYYKISYKPPVFWGMHRFTTYLDIAGKKGDTLSASGEYDTAPFLADTNITQKFERPIMFDFDSSSIKAESYYILDELADFMLNYPKLRIEVQGHTDAKGSLEYNMKLSEKRAKAVMDALLARGIEEKRLRSRGFAFTMPVAPNDTEENRALNRRTVFLILAK